MTLAWCSTSLCKARAVQIFPGLICTLYSCGEVVVPPDPPVDTSQHLHNHATQVGMIGNVDDPVTVGTIMWFKKNGQIKSIWFFKPANDTANTREVAIWEDAGFNAGTLLRVATTSGEPSGPAWIEVPITPINVYAGMTYVICARYPTSHYPAQAHFFDGGDIVNGDVVGPDTSSYSPGNGRFKYSSVIEYPTGTFNAGCYFTDVSFVAST